jgi:hypothetical protein
VAAADLGAFHRRRSDRGLGLAAIRGAVSSRVGLAFALFALICCVIAWRGFADGTPFIAYRAASFFGMASLIGAAAAVWSIPHKAGPRMRQVYRITGFVGAACLCVMAAAGSGYWTQSFVRPHTDYSTLADINEKAYLRALPGLRAAIDRAPLGSIGVYLPPVDFAALPWPQLLYVHMMAAQRDAVFLSGFMNNNNDTRTPTSDGVYDPERTVEYVLVTVVRDPVPAVFGGERVGHGRGFRLYRIAPTPWRTVRDQLASADSEGRGE